MFLAIVWGGLIHEKGFNLFLFMFCLRWKTYFKGILFHYFYYLSFYLSMKWDSVIEHCEFLFRMNWFIGIYNIGMELFVRNKFFNSNLFILIFLFFKMLPISDEANLFMYSYTSFTSTEIKPVLRWLHNIWNASTLWTFL